MLIKRVMLILGGLPFALYADPNGSSLMGIGLLIGFAAVAVMVLLIVGFVVAIIKMWVFPKKITVEEPQQETPQPIDETQSTLQEQTVSQRDATDNVTKLFYTIVMIFFIFVIYNLLMQLM